MARDLPPKDWEAGEGIMIRASELYGRPVVDLDTAEKVGTIDEIIVDTDAPSVAGYVIAEGGSLFGRGKRSLIASEVVHAIGPDAITIQKKSSYDIGHAYLDSLPRLSELSGRRMISRGGRLLGIVEEALIDERSGRIIGYPLDSTRVAPGLERVFGLAATSSQIRYVRADADLRLGSRIVVVPDDAVATYDDAPLPEPVQVAESANGVDSAYAVDSDDIPIPESSTPRRRTTTAARTQAIPVLPNLPEPPLTPSWQDLPESNVADGEQDVQEVDTSPLPRGQTALARRRRSG